MSLSCCCWCRKQDEPCSSIRQTRELEGYPPISAELNILLLGETGVGKSTWINGFANYLTYSTLDEAEENEFVSVIPTKFTITDSETYESKVISTGSDYNENHGDGESATQSPKTYLFPLGNTTIRLIDTAGIGDTRGYDQDKQNFQSTLSHIAKLDMLHGIFILLKPNNPRLNVMFKFCVKELLANLHKDASRNIVFCFTNSRGTFYTPGDTMDPLRRLLVENGVNIELNKESIYCFDNEAVRFLAALKSGVRFNKKQHKLFSNSWDKSVEETERLVTHITSCRPHVVKKMLIISQARQMILALNKPLAAITDAIQENLTAIATARREIEESIADKEEIAQRLYIPHIETKNIKLDCTHLVCTSKNCLEYVIDGDERKIKYSCFVKYDPYEVKDKSAPCGTCGCSRKDHKKIEYEIVQYETKVVDSEVMRQVTDKEDAIQAIDDHLKKLEFWREELDSEQHEITRTSAEFACFLKLNAITPYNDTMAEYLDYFIHARNAGTTLTNLELIREKYNEEFKILEAALSDPNSDLKPLEPDDIKSKITTLYTLKHAGPMLQFLIDNIQNERQPVQHANDVVVTQPRFVQKQEKLNTLQKFLRREKSVKKNNIKV